jgi:hypothetical protein
MRVVRDALEMSPDRLDLHERDLQAHARSITEITNVISGIQRDKAVQEVKDEHLQERLDGIEGTVKAIYKLGWWILSTFGAVLIATITSLVKGGLVGP